MYSPIRPRLDVLLVGGGVLTLLVTLIQPQFSPPARGGPPANGSATAVGAVDPASPSPSSLELGPIATASLAPSDAPGTSLTVPVRPMATPVPPRAPSTPTPAPAPRTGRTPAPTPPPTHNPPPAPTPSPTEVATIHLSGSIADLSSGATAQTLTATVRNSLNRPVAGQKVSFTQVAGTGTVTGLGTALSDSIGVATARLVGGRAGSITVTVQADSISTKVSFTVVAGALDHVILSPGFAVIASGGSQVFTTIAYDAAGNAIGDVSASARLSIARGGMCSASSCTATKGGPHIVISVYEGRFDTAILMVHGKSGDTE